MNKKLVLISTIVLISIGCGATAISREMKPERIYHITDRNYYISGEKIWFEAFVRPPLDSTFQSRILYLEIYDEKKDIVHQQKFNLNNFKATGYVDLPDNIRSGNYIMRTYTLYQRNFSPWNYFHSMITIINPKQPLSDSKEKKPGFLIGSDDMNQSYSVYVGKTYLDMKPVKAWVSAQDTLVGIVPVKLFESGLATFHLNGDISDSYRFNMLVANQDTLSHNFQVNEKKGISLIVQLNNGLFEVSYDNPKKAKGDYVFKVWDETGQKIEKQVTLANQSGTVDVIAAEKFEDGYVAFILEKRDGQKVSGKLGFNYQDDDTIISIETGHNKLNPKRRMEFSFQSNGVLDEANVRMVKKNTLYNKGQEIASLIYNPSLAKNSLFDGTLTRNDMKLILPLLEEKVIEELKSQDSRAKNQVFLPETDGLNLRAIARNKNTLEPVENVPVYLSVLNKGGYFIPRYSGANGELNYTLYNLEGEQNIFLTIPQEYKDSVEVLIENDFAVSMVGFTVPPLHLKPSDKSFIEDLSLSSQIHALSNFETISRESLTALPDKFYGEPESHVRLKDYIDLPTLEEVFHEIVMNAIVRKRKGSPYFVLYENHNLYAYKDPLVLLDNVPVFNYSELLEIAPSKIDYIDVVNGIYIVGNSVFRGIISIYTYKSDFGGYTFPDEVVYAKYLTSTPKTQQMYNSTNKGNDYRADFRNLVFFQSISNGESSTINLPDNTGDFKVLVRGMNHDGTLIRKEKSIKIKKESHQDLTHFPLHIPVSSTW